MFDTVTGLLKAKDLPACVLLAIAFIEYGADCFDWEPEILRAEMSDDFGVELTDSQADKLQAAITIISTDQVESNWHAFNTAVHCLNSEPVDYDVFDPIEAEQIASAVAEIQLIRNQFTDGDLVFGDEVNTYAGLIFSEYGLLFAPHIFLTANMPALPGEHYSDSQTEKQDALSEIYSLKKNQIEGYLTRLHNCYKT